MFLVIIYLDNIWIYTKDLSQPYIEAIYWILNQLQKYFLFANPKKYYFHQDEIRFLGYVVSYKDIRMKAERIEVIKDWLEPKSVSNI